ncbi:MAG: hypothetical protein JKY37_25015 [Nannocystaceae bacterium]|nr:hypothetical protein [Nannocystaceae bacterium]
MLDHLFLLTTLAYAGPSAESAELEGKVQALFEDCTMCHDTSGDPSDPGGLDLESPLSALIGRKSAAVDKLLVDPGNPAGSYLIEKLVGAEGIDGEIMPVGDDPYSAEQLKLVSDWIASLPASTSDDAAPDNGGGTDPGAAAAVVPAPAAAKGTKPFRGITQIVLPTTTTLGRNTLQYRIDHRFGRIGTERGAFGLDAGVVMSMGMSYGILDGWDVMLRRSSTRKNYELGTKYVPLRQEDGAPVSVGGYTSLEYFRDFDVANRWTGNFQAMVSRLWFDRWSTMLTLGYHLRTNHNARVIVDRGEGPEPVEDRRDTMVVGFASTIWLGKKRRWGIDMEYFLPIPDGGEPNTFYYRGGDADPDGAKIGAWALGGSYYTGKHFFQVFFTNNRSINTNLAASGGQSGNPFNDPSAEHDNPLNEINFFLGFNLGRRFTLGKNAKKRKQKKAAATGGN